MSQNWFLLVFSRRIRRLIINIHPGLLGFLRLQFSRPIWNTFTNVLFRIRNSQNIYLAYTSSGWRHNVFFFFKLGCLLRGALQIKRWLILELNSYELSFIMFPYTCVHGTCIFVLVIGVSWSITTGQRTAVKIVFFFFLYSLERNN